jgi:hypothetical protein
MRILQRFAGSISITRDETVGVLRKGILADIGDVAERRHRALGLVGHGVE